MHSLFRKLCIPIDLNMFAMVYDISGDSGR